MRARAADPTPAISSINTNAPNQTDFVAGTTTSFTITGQHFGTYPQVTISGTACTSGNYCGVTGTASDTSVAGWITLDAGASGSATVTVTSQGHGNPLAYQPNTAHPHWTAAVNPH
jgi:hypothetical protein